MEENNHNKKVARWTIGPVSDSGFECLEMSINSFLSHHKIDHVVIYHNCKRSQIPSSLSDFDIIDQSQFLTHTVTPKGVAWKLYPTRHNIAHHEIHIDNDIVFSSTIPEIESFLTGDFTLLLGAASRNYGQFDNHVSPGLNINSGIFGMPPQFNFQKYFDFYVNKQWEENATGKHASSKTFDEQGLVAFALSSHRKFVIIPDDSVTNCENNLIWGNGMHFIGLNRNNFHLPYRLYKSNTTKFFL